MKILRAIFLCIAAASAAYGGDFSSSAKGTSAGYFLRLSAGARGAAMGEACSASANSADALYWNPAALTRVQGRSAVFTHSAYLDSAFFDYAAYAVNLSGNGAIGAGIQYFSAGSIAETDVSGVETGNFSPSDTAVSLGYAYKLRNMERFSALNGYSLGASVKFIRLKIADPASTLAADLGVLSKSYYERFRLAFTASNLGGKIKFGEVSESLPVLLKIGSSVKIMPDWVATADGFIPRDNKPYLALGTESLLHRSSAGVFLTGRAGFNFRTSGDIAGFTGFSTGLGIKYRKFGLDYSFLPLGALGLTHYISFSMNF